MEDYNRVKKSEWETFYYLDNKLHRIDGPAYENFYGYKEWWIEGEKIDCNSQEEFERYVKLKLFW